MRRALGLVGAALVVLGAAGLSLSGKWPWRRMPETQLPPLSVPMAWTVADTLRRGESLGRLFERHGVGAIDLARVVTLLGVDPRRLQAGLIFHFRHSTRDSVLDQVTLRTPRADEEVRVVKGVDDWVAERRAIRWAARPVRVTGTISSSLYEAMAQAEASEQLTEDERIRLAWDLADVFAWEVDFTRDLQPDDRFEVVFERQTSEQGEQRTGQILASKLTITGRPLSAFRFELDGRSEFFDEGGVSLRRSFLRAPVEFRRVASGFSRSRLHPILGTWRKHEGIDYSASTGTSVLAAGDGQVASIGWSGGYGRMVEVAHRNGIRTRYAHLSGFAAGLRTGDRVHQGEVIGYVGSSGLATAPHLHYEFRQGGAARDPARVDLGPGAPVPSAKRSEFELVRQRLEILLNPPAPPVPDLSTGSE